MRRYETKQREVLLGFLERHCDEQYTVEQIAQALCGEQGISRSAIYRNIAAMEQSGSVRRFPGPQGRGFLYQYVSGDCDRHLHLKCDGCGQLFHLDEGAMAGIVQAAQLGGGFTVDIQKTTLHGRCRSCETCGGEERP